MISSNFYYFRLLWPVSSNILLTLLAHSVGILSKFLSNGIYKRLLLWAECFLYFEFYVNHFSFFVWFFLRNSRLISHYASFVMLCKDKFVINEKWHANHSTTTVERIQILSSNVGHRECKTIKTNCRRQQNRQRFSDNYIEVKIIFLKLRHSSYIKWTL